MRRGSACEVDIFICDSQNQNGSIIRYPISSWHVFLKDAKEGLFDLDCLS